MSPLVAAVLVGLAAALLMRSPPRARARRAQPVASRRGAEPAGAGRAPGRAPERAPVGPWVAAVTGGVGAGLLVGGAPGWPVGLVVGTALAMGLRRLEPRAVRERRSRVEEALPTAVDLLAACLAAGRPPTVALPAVADAVGGPLAADLDHVSARLRLGGDPGSAWRAVAREGSSLAPLGRTMARSLETGAPAVDGLVRLGADLRRERRAHADRRARSVGVRSAAPLGLCFLPAFVLVGVVPAVVAAFSSMTWW